MLHKVVEDEALPLSANYLQTCLYSTSSFQLVVFETTLLHNAVPHDTILFDSTSHSCKYNYFCNLRRSAHISISTEIESLPRGGRMQKTVLLVHAHPEPTSLT